jgi:hypothetical protein
MNKWAQLALETPCWKSFSTETKHLDSYWYSGTSKIGHSFLPSPRLRVQGLPLHALILQPRSGKLTRGPLPGNAFPRDIVLLRPIECSPCRKLCTVHACTPMMSLQEVTSTSTAIVWLIVRKSPEHWFRISYYIYKSFPLTFEFHCVSSPGSSQRSKFELILNIRTQ